MLLQKLKEAEKRKNDRSRNALQFPEGVSRRRKNLSNKLRTQSLNVTFSNKQSRAVRVIACTEQQQIAHDLRYPTALHHITQYSPDMVGFIDLIESRCYCQQNDSAE